MELDPMLHTKSMDIQLQTLIVDAFSYLSPPPQCSYLVIIDGLDECHDKATQQSILRLLCETITVHKLPLRFLIGSRSESHIRDSFDQKSLYAVTRRVTLDEKFDPGRDIQVFLQDGYQIPTSASITSASSSSLRSSLHHADSDSRLTPPESSFSQLEDNKRNKFHLRTSTSAQTLSSSHSPSPLSDNGSTSPGGCGSSEMFNISNINPDDEDGSDQNIVDSAIRMSPENCFSASAGRKGIVIRAKEEEKNETLTTSPVKKKSKIHCCEICFKKFPR
jgi:hypothetical protein